MAPTVFLFVVATASNHPQTPHVLAALNALGTSQIQLVPIVKPSTD